MNRELNNRQSASVARSMGMLWFVLFIFLSDMSFALQPVDFKFHVTRDAKRSYDGLDGFNYERIETAFIAPIFKRNNYAGRWFVGADLSENRMFLSGAQTGTRRFYRFALPIQYFPRRVGRTQHEWMLTPSYFTDESFIDQNRIDFEYAWQLRFFKTRKISFIGGVRNDSRFGASAMNPIFGVELRPNKRIFHHWVFPDIYSELTLNRKLTAKAFIQINGGNWEYLLADGSGTASFGISDWKSGLGFKLKTRMPFEIVGEVGLRMMGTGAIAGSSGALANSYFFSVGLQTPIDLKTSRNRRR